MCLCGAEITPKKPEEVEDKLREIFSVTDRLSYHEVNAVAKQVGGPWEVPS